MDPVEHEKRIREIEELLKDLRLRFSNFTSQAITWEDYEATWAEKSRLLSEEEKEMLWVTPEDRKKDLARITKESSRIIERIFRLEKQLEELQNFDIELKINDKNQKLALSPKENTRLNEKIVEVVEQYISDGHTLEESFRFAADKSRLHFARWLKLSKIAKITKGTIEGRYKRNKSKFI